MNTANTSVSENQIYSGLTVKQNSAPLSKRFLAYCVDLGLISAVLYAVILVGFILTGMGFGGVKLFSGSFNLEGVSSLGAIAFFLLLILGLVLAMVLYHGYFVYQEFKKGTTIGKRLFGLRVVSTSGRSLTLGQCILRDVMRYVDCTLVFPGLVAMLANPEKKRLGDFMANTWVIYSRQKEEEQKTVYMDLTKYLSLKSQVEISPVPKAVRDEYLKFAFKNLTSGTFSYMDQINAGALSNIKSYIKFPEGQIKPGTLFYFFAEHCFQLENDSNKGGLSE